MILTERQCWDIIRALVKEKNDEYSSFLLSMFDNNQMREILGYTRDTFLSKMGVPSLSRFNYDIKTYVGRQPSAQWLDNLSSMDLILFLDFRCRLLQQIYDHYQKFNYIGINEIKNIAKDTKVSRLRGFNYGSLQCTGKPERRKGEQKVAELEYSVSTLKNSVLNQVLNEMVDIYIDVQRKPIEEVVTIAKAITTSNTDTNGYTTGFEFECDIITDDTEFKPKKAGFDIQGIPVLEHEDGYYTSTGRKLDENEKIYSNDQLDSFGF